MRVRAWGARVGAAAVAAMVTVLSPGAGAAGTNTGADGTAGASAADSAGSNRFVVKPGQSLSDIASAVIQSNDWAMRDRMVALLFEANPGAFMGRDPNRLKIGAVIQVPDGAVATVMAAASAMAASGAAGSSLPPATPSPTLSAGAIQRAPQPSNTATGMSGAPSPTLASHAAALGSAAPGAATPGGVAFSGASSDVTLGVTSGASTPSASQAEGVPAHQASTPATAGAAAIVLEPGSVASAPPSASAAQAVSTTAVAASQGTARAPARMGASLRLSPATTAGAAALAFLLVGWLIALVRRRQRAAATVNMREAQGIGPREETRAGVARAPDGGLPHRASAMRTGSESSDGTAAHAGDEALQAAVAAAAMGVAATTVAAAVTRNAGRGSHATSDAEPPVVSGSSDAIDSERAQELAHVVPVAHEDGEDRDDQSLLAPDFPAHAAAALASLELSLPPLPSTPSSVYDAVIADAQTAAVECGAPMAPPPSVAPPPLGAAHVGALNLDFDLDLPPLATQQSVAPALDEIAAIARNKLNLAVESMKWGDTAGARALVSEVIASNEPTTLEKARALHAALASR
ncbi:hypothetical protein [Mycetohabitans sp. B46]|uniref:hypothetical protein n=1 Tax=Mycetohabitans sp. B46 TaxID=2772536 RepID=UPI00307F957C